MPRMSYDEVRGVITAHVPDEGITHTELVARLEREGHAALVPQIAALVARGDLVAQVVATTPDTPARLVYTPKGA